MAFFGLSLWSFLRFEKAAQTARAEDAKTQRNWYLFSIAAFALSLLAKTATVMLPFVLLGMALCQRSKINRRDLIRAVPFFAVALVMGLITIWFQYNRAIATAVVNESTFLQRLAGAGWNVWFYLYKALIPINLTFVYPRWEIEAKNVLVYLPGVVVLMVLAATWLLRARIGRGPFIAFAYFVVTLFPVLGFLNIYFQRYSFVADHWQYISIIGIIALICAGAVRFLKANSTYALGAVAVLLGFLSWKQAAIYENHLTLWRDTLKKNPHCWMAYGNLGLYYANQNPPDFAQAIPNYEQALTLNPKSDGDLYNLGVAYLQTGRPTDAIKKFEETLALNPNHKHALPSLAWLRAISKEPQLRNGQQAVQLATRAVEITKGQDEWNLDTLAAAYAEAGQFDKAVETETKAIAIAQAKGSPQAVSEMQGRLQLYQSGQPFHER